MGRLRPAGGPEGGAQGSSGSCGLRWNEGGRVAGEMRTSMPHAWGETRAHEGAGGALRNGGRPEDPASAGRGGEANSVQRVRGDRARGKAGEDTSSSARACASAACRPPWARAECAKGDGGCHRGRPAAAGLPGMDRASSCQRVVAAQAAGDRGHPEGQSRRAGESSTSEAEDRPSLRAASLGWRTQLDAHLADRGPPGAPALSPAPA